MSRALWSAALLVCVVAIVAGGVYAYRLPSVQGSPAPLLLGVPFVLLARLAWRRLQRAD